MNYKAAMIMLNDSTHTLQGENVVKNSFQESFNRLSKEKGYVGTLVFDGEKWENYKPKNSKFEVEIHE